ncbi:MAG: zinc ABC transporter substrate-binding protein [Acidobacteriota bacterium]|nr:zinc ABC transporter substrate-binding protein [Acidobacteriota bacterium]MDH3784431.1 zinc ABC transporter substrate-binding protein [Acidobacteriota bacterium]
MSKTIQAVLTIAVVALVTGCASDPTDRAAGDGPLKIVATTGMIGDAAAIVGGDAVNVETLMGPGVDPHLFKASEGDVQRLGDADLILYNGLHLEGKMTDILVKLASRRPIVAVGGELPEERLREPPEFLGQYDPHIWFDVELWSRTLTFIAEALVELRPEHAETFRANAESYRQALLELDSWAKDRIESIPESRRILVTAHDAFGYFGERYGVRVVGLQGLSTLAEAGLKDMERVVDIVVDSGIDAIFVETSVPRRAIEAVQAACRARGADVEIGGELFSDAMGAEGSPEGTYIGMVRHNVNTIVEALQ